MSNQTLKLAVKKPCTENWATMTPNEKGKHCFSCQKTVVDFTMMTDSQIIQYFQTYQGKTCGRFLDTQLQRPILPPVLPKNQTRWAWLFSVLLLPISAKAQQTTEFNIEQVSKNVFDMEWKEVHKVKIPMKDTQIGEHNLDVNRLILPVYLTGDVDREEPTATPLKPSKEIVQDLFDSFTNMIMSVLSFFKNL